MQQAYDLWHAEQRMKDELAKIKIAARGMLKGFGILKAYLKEKRLEKQRENKSVAGTK